MKTPTRKPLFAVRGAVADLDTREARILLDRGFTTDPLVRDRVSTILARVWEERDAALRALARELDGVDLDELEVPRERCIRALAALDPELRRVLRRAAENITRVHRAIPVVEMEVEPEPGIIIGRRPDPLARVGVYAPGGRATYPSSVLMGAIPARVAGVREITLCSPPSRGTGLPSEIVLAAAALAGVDRVFALGGAGAIGAMAYGTESIARVDRIVGPGNAYVAEAKLQIRNTVATDSPAGPSELLIIADTSADPELVAREMLAQAEHDTDACVVCIMIDGAAPDVVEGTVRSRLVDQARAMIIASALATRGALLTAPTADEALAFAERYAPEHLLLAVRDADALARRVRNAGTIFVGASSSVTFGDYMTGANHVLPTGGLARCYSGLSTLDFVRWTSYQRVTPAAAARLADDVARFAESERLTAHADAARMWATPANAEAMR
ncbi:MAG TPA: histidinol dehydrogenase [Gemmatimonadaceae bacterium]|nr:histidinol dehydrogenase [Gemmatimonadaceae bacterium]